MNTKDKYFAQIYKYFSQSKEDLIVGIVGRFLAFVLVFFFFRWVFNGVRNLLQ